MLRAAQIVMEAAAHHAVHRGNGGPIDPDICKPQRRPITVEPPAMPDCP